MSERVPGSRRRRAAARPGVMTVSHGHPAFTRGGAEAAAYALHRHMLADGRCTPWFLGCRTQGAPVRAGAVITQPLGADEYVYQPGAFEWFNFANRDPAFPAAFAAVLRETRPEVVHFHHFAHLGIEALGIARAVLPGARIVLTLHEFLLICHAHGQMVTRRDRALCPRATLDACHDCFPERTQGDFLLRRAYLQRFLPVVDAFVAPSGFLAGRMVEWGVPAGRLHVIENLVPAGDGVRRAAMGDGPLRVGFFGQVSRLKGTTVLLEAAALLAARGDDVTIDVHGTMTGQPPEMQEEFRRLMGGAGSNVRYRGGYRPEAVDGLMQGVDLVVVPSTWWENSPVVIQEAFRNGRPVLCSDIGGMREKVAAGRNGWWFPVGDAMSLAAVLRRLAGDRAEVAAMAAGVAAPEEADAVFRRHHALYFSAG